MKSVAKTTKRSSATTKKAVKKTVPTKKVATKKTQKLSNKSSQHVTKAIKKAVTKKTKLTTKKVTKRVVKKVVKTAKRTTKRVRAQAEEETVRSARMYGHANTMPTGKNAPGRILGRVITLSIIGGLKIPIDGDVIAISVARVGGIGCMLIGAALAWNLSTMLVVVPQSIQSAQLLAATEDNLAPVQFDVAAPAPLQGTVPVVVSTAAESVSLWYQIGTSTPQIAGMATRQSDASHTFLLDVTAIQASEIQLLAGLTTPTGIELFAEGMWRNIAGVDEVEAQLATSTVTEMLPVVAELSNATRTTATTTQDSTEPATTTSAINTATTNPTPEPIVMTAPVAPTSMVLSAPSVLGVAYHNGNSIVYGTSTAATQVELVALGASVRELLSVTTTGWWQYATTSSVFTQDSYEIYAIADSTEISQMYRLTSESLVTAAAPTQSSQNPHYVILLWYLLAACAVIGIGAVLLLIGQHMHHDRRYLANSPSSAA